MFTGIFASSWFVRLPDDERAELAAAGGTPFEPMPGRPMREYMVMPPETAADPAAAEPWVGRGAGLRRAAAAEEEALGQELAHQLDDAVGRLELDRVPDAGNRLVAGVRDERRDLFLHGRRHDPVGLRHHHQRRAR